MYNKLFSKIVNSSVWLSPTDHRIVWITFLALMDQDGFVAIASIPNVAHTARVSLEAAQEAVLAFESPDPLDSTQEFEGRRVERVPGGWMVLNAPKYRAMATAENIREQTRLRTQVYRQRKAEAGDASVTHRIENVTPSETDSEANTNSEAMKKVGGRAARSTATHLPADFELTDDRKTYAVTENIDPAREFAKFCDYWRAASGAAARKRDWDAAWRGWCRKAADFKPAARIANKSFSTAERSNWVPPEMRNAAK